MNGYVRLFRKFVNWEWYKNNITKIVFLHCLLKANWEDSKFEGNEIKRGSFITGRKKLSEELGISEQEVRTSLNHLISTNEITIKKTNKYSIISINNYDAYQFNNQENNQQITNNQPTNNQQSTTYEKEKEDEEEQKNIIYNNIYELIEKSFKRTLNSDEKEEISKWNDNELTRYAIKQASLRHIDNVNYINAILYAYKENNIKTVDEAKKREKEYRKNNNKTVVKNEASVPKWFNEDIKSEKPTEEEIKEINDILSDLGL